MRAGRLVSSIAIAAAVPFGAAGGWLAYARAQETDAADKKWEQQWEQFPHYMHRSKSDPARGCTECHTTGDQPIGGGNLRYVTLDNCEQCHQTANRFPRLKGPFEKLKRVRTKVEAVEMFTDFDHFLHHDKAGMTCNTCHSYGEVEGKKRHTGRRKKVYEDFFTTPAIEDCRGCHEFPHEEHDLKREVYRHPEQKCEECHVGQEKIFAFPDELRTPPDEAGRLAFSHLEHLGGVDYDKADKKLCLRCHLEADRSKRLDDGKFVGLREKSCYGECHSMPEGKTFAVAIAKDDKELLPELPEFPHDAHLEDISCSKCHELRADDTWAFAQGKLEKLPKYDGCVAAGCHDDWKVEAHEDAKKNEPFRCRRCHTGNPDKPEELLSKKFEKRRLGPMTYDESAHPYICPTPAGRTAQQTGRLDACKECHRADSLPVQSRIKGERFSHKSHLRPELREKKVIKNDEVCTECHTGITKSQDPSTSMDVDLERGGGCERCHVGSKAQIPEAKTEVVARHPGFSHEIHMASTEYVGMSCATCHDYDTVNDVMQIKPKALDCSECHDHKDGRARWTGPSGLGACNRCHIGESIFLADKAPRPVRKALSTTVRAEVGEYHRDHTGKCNLCHPSNQKKGRAVERNGVEKIVYTNFSHPKAPSSIPPNQIFEKFCNECHIKKMGPGPK